MKILVTGASGFIGQQLVESLVRKNHLVRCLIRETSKTDYLKSLNVELVVGDILNKKSLQKAVRNIDLIYHTVGVGSLTDNSSSAFKRYKKINVVGTANLLTAGHKNQIKGFIYLSSLAAQGLTTKEVTTEKTSPNPKSAYEKSKYQSEQVVEKFRNKQTFPITVIRPAMVYGPGAIKSEILLLAKIISLHLCPLVGNGKNSLPVIYIRDLIKTISNIADSNKIPNKTYNLTREDSITYLQLLVSIRQTLTTSCLFVHVPVSLAQLGAYFLERWATLTKTTPLMTSQRINSLTSNRVFDTSLARRELNFSSIPFDKTISQTVNWYQKNGYL